MKLSYSNCRIEISDEKIECEYDLLFNDISWTLTLGEKIIYQSNSKEIIISPEEIIEFQFEIEDMQRQSRPRTQEAYVYYLKKNESDPKEFFRICIYEASKLSSQTKSYEFANEILKVISNKYNIPFSFKYSIETKEKETKVSILLLFIIISILFAIFGIKYSSSHRNPIRPHGYIDNDSAVPKLRIPCP